jgi:hypothetical protein
MARSGGGVGAVVPSKITITQLDGLNAVSQLGIVLQLTPAQRQKLYASATPSQLAGLAPAARGMLNPIGDAGVPGTPSYNRYKGIVGGEIDKTQSNNTNASQSSGSTGSGSGVSPSASGSYSYSQLEQIWISNGGPSVAAPIAAAIAMAESSGNPQATDDDGNGSVDRGLWQINSVHGNLSTYDVNANARAAIQISSGGRDWSPWTTYTSGAYRQYLSSGTVPSPYTSSPPSAGITRPGGGTAGAEDTSGVQALFASYDSELTATNGVGGPTDFVSLGSTITSALGLSSVASIPGQVASSITDVGTFLSWIAWIFHPRNILRAVEFLTGIAVMFYGLHSVLVQQYGAANPAAEATRRGAGVAGDVIGGTVIGHEVRRAQGRRSGRSAARMESRRQERNSAHKSTYKSESARRAKQANSREAKKIPMSEIPF